MFHQRPNCHDRAAEQIDIVFDKTKAYSEAQSHSVDDTLKELLTRAADNAEINLYYITRDGEKAYLVLNECKPATHGNAMFVDVNQQQREFRERIVKRVKEKIDLRFEAPTSAPILESLATISRRRIITSKIEQNIRVEFDIYSDMAQDSRTVSIEGLAHLDPSSHRRDNSRCTIVVHAGADDFNDLYGRVKRFFENVPVNVYGIYRDPRTSPRYPGEYCVRKFWEGTFPHLSWVTF
jgi:hypothetical protein